MLIHIKPTMYADIPEATSLIELIDITCRELQLSLTAAGRDITAGRPYPNKAWLVACRPRGNRKAIDGILIETDAPVREFTVSTRWAAAGEMVLTHRVRYIVIDEDHDATSEDMMIWGDRRRKVYPPEISPLHAEPGVALMPGTGMGGIDRAVGVVDTLSGDDSWVTEMERAEVFRMPTVEARRLEPGGRSLPWSRLPDRSEAFVGRVL